MIIQSDHKRPGAVGRRAAGARGQADNPVANMPRLAEDDDDGTDQQRKIDIHDKDSDEAQSRLMMMMTTTTTNQEQEKPLKEEDEGSDEKGRNAMGRKESAMTAARLGLYKLPSQSSRAVLLFAGPLGARARERRATERPKAKRATAKV